MSNTGKLRRNLLCSSTLSDPFSICACVWFEELIDLVLFRSPEAILYFSATGGKSHFPRAVGSMRSWVYFCISSQGMPIYPHSRVVLIIGDFSNAQ